MIFCKYQNCCNFIVSILGANVTWDLYNAMWRGEGGKMTWPVWPTVMQPRWQPRSVSTTTGPARTTGPANVRTNTGNVLRKIISLLQVPGDTREQKANPTAENTRVRTQGTLPSPQQHISAHKMFTIITTSVTRAQFKVIGTAVLLWQLSTSSSRGTLSSNILWNFCIVISFHAVTFLHFFINIVVPFFCQREQYYLVYRCLLWAADIWRWTPEEI